MWSPVRQRGVTYKHTGNVHALACTHAHLKGWALQIALYLARTHAQQTFTDMPKGQDSTTGKNMWRNIGKDQKMQNKTIYTILIRRGWNSFSHSWGLFKYFFFFFFVFQGNKYWEWSKKTPQDKPKVRREEKRWNLKGCPFRWGPKNAHGECFSWSLRSRPLWDML